MTKNCHSSASLMIIINVTTNEFILSLRPSARSQPALAGNKRFRPADILGILKRQKPDLKKTIDAFKYDYRYAGLFSASARFLWPGALKRKTTLNLALNEFHYNFMLRIYNCFWTPMIATSNVLPPPFRKTLLCHNTHEIFRCQHSVFKDSTACFRRSKLN